MNRQKSYGRLDSFRVAAALLVVAIHTSPLGSVSADADFFLTRILARTAVPFFFMTTGYFVLRPLFSGAAPGDTLSAASVRPVRKGDPQAVCALKRCLKKLCLLYFVSILLYLPVGVYAGHYRELNLGGALKMLLFDGTFYHLWYFPACILGILLVWLMSRFLSLKAAVICSFILYAAGLLGDSYFGLADKVPFLHTAYEAMFTVFSYTRNGLFMAPLFLVMGIWAGNYLSVPYGTRRVSEAGRGGRRYFPGRSLSPALFYGVCLALSLAACTAEAFLLRNQGLQRHDSMYLFLVPAVLFLYLLLCALPEKPSHKELRAICLWIYILHPGFIVVVRGLAKPLGLTALLVDNSILHYLSVTVLSVAASTGLTLLLKKLAATKRMSRVLPGKIGAAPGSGHARAGLPASKDCRESSALRAWIELDTAALAHNVRFLQSLMPGECRLMPAVKANAYGHGAVPIARELSRLGIDAFCVACASEGIELRKAGIKGEILILGYTPLELFPLLGRYRLTQTVLDYAYAECMRESGVPLHVHIAVDTGMHRLGIRCEETEQIAAVYQMNNLTVDGIYTHLAACDSDSPESRSFTGDQIAAFYQTTEALKAMGCPCRGLHLLSSYGILNYPDAAGDYVRPGIALYGLLSTAEDSRNIGAVLKTHGSRPDKAASSPLRPVLSLKARVASLRTLHKGEAAGYGLAFIAERDMKLAVLSIGYADGLPRTLSGGNGRVLINGYSAPILGRVCMDQTLVDVSHIPETVQGDTAVLIGCQGGQEITAGELAERCGTIANEILSRLGGRLERISV